MSSEGWLKLDFDGHVLVHLPIPDRTLTKINELVREVRNQGTVATDAISGRRFGAAANPVLRVAKPKTRQLARGNRAEREMFPVS